MQRCPAGMLGRARMRSPLITSSASVGSGLARATASTPRVVAVITAA